MIEGIPIVLTELGAGGLLVIAIAVPMLMLYRRKLIPEKDLLDAREEKNYWRAAYEREAEAGRKKDDQVGELVVAVAENNRLGELSVAMLQSLRDKANT